jgi:hypothetical protein
MPTIDSLEPVAIAADSDLFAVSQGGVAKRVTRGQIIAGTQPLLALGQHEILGRFSAGTGGPEALGLGSGFAISHGLLSVSAPVPGDAVTPEAFGAVGDGTTDDRAAFEAAIDSGKPVRLGPKTYGLSGQWTIAAANAVLLGTPGLSVLRRIAHGGGAFVSVQGNGFRAEGVTFDANGADVPDEAWGVLVTAECHAASFRDCRFLAAPGPVLGCGLVLQGDSALRDHLVQDCVFSGNAAHGLWVQAVSGALVQGCRALANGGYGITVDFNDAAFTSQARLMRVADNRAWGNLRGISVGNFNASNAEPPVWGNANPDAIGVIVSGNICHDNFRYGIAAAGRAIAVQDNLLVANGEGITGGAGILANIAASRIAGNIVSGQATYGIDCGGSEGVSVADNLVLAGGLYGINGGGSVDLAIEGNRVSGASLFAICVAATEADGEGRPFPLAAGPVSIADNAIAIPAGAGGIWLRDGVQKVAVLRNRFTGPVAAADCLRADTDGFTVAGNACNGAARLSATVDASGLLVVPDIADSLLVTAASATVTAMRGASAIGAGGAIRFVRITAGGSGYTHAAITIGPAGSGAAAAAVLSGGQVIGAIVTAGGSGYGLPGAAIAVAITGDGSGAAGVAYAGAPLAEDRRLLLRCNVPLRFAVAGANPPQENWSFADLRVPALGSVEWTATFGAWRAGGFSMASWLGTDATGAALLRSIGNGDISLHPAGSGRVHIGSDAEPAGIVTAIGHGSPEGGVCAPPGSDYRNLDGGLGSTLWIKRLGTGSSGWVAVA